VIKYVELDVRYPNYDVIGDPKLSKSAGLSSRYTEDSLRGIVIDIHLLSLTDYLVCTFSSQVSHESVSLLSVATHADPTFTHHAIFHEWRISSLTFTSAHFYANIYLRVGVACTLTDLSDCGLLGEQTSQKWEIFCLGRWWTAVQNLTPQALSSVEKSVTVQIQTNKHTNSKRYIHTLPVGMCG